MIGWKNVWRKSSDENNEKTESPAMRIYREASAMENQLRGMMRQDPYALLTDGPADAYNHLVEAVRELVPGSVALKEDVEPIDEEHELAVDDAFRAVHVTLLPIIHNALPEQEYAAV